jgi:hypothetical protein
MLNQVHNVYNPTAILTLSQTIIDTDSKNLLIDKYPCTCSRASPAVIGQPNGSCMSPSLARSQRASIAANSIATIRTEALECPFFLFMRRVGKRGPLFVRHRTLATQLLPSGPPLVQSHAFRGGVTRYAEDPSVQ